MPETQALALLSLFGCEPASYRPHPLHAAERAFIETNCYTDVWIELLHTRGDEPLAVLGVTLRADFEGDQWTFFKPPPGDLALLYGIDVHELQPYRPLPVQLAEQLAVGRTLLVEVDSWYLPDTRATSYRTEHVKSAIAVEGIDREGERLRYFHGNGLYELEGDDYRGLFRIGRTLSEDVLPPYVELVRFDAGPSLRGAELRDAARAVLRGHLAARPSRNPFRGFAEQLERELPELLGGDLAGYHAYAFATARMMGSAFELAASHVEWAYGAPAEAAAADLRRIVAGAKVLGFRLARRRPFDPSPILDELEQAWDDGTARLDELTA